MAASFVLGWRLVNEGTVFGAGGSMAARAGAFLLFLLETIALSVPAAALAVPVLSGSGMGKTLVQDKRTEGMTRRRRRKEKNLTLRPLWQVWLFYSLLIFSAGCRFFWLIILRCLLTTRRASFIR